MPFLAAATGGGARLYSQCRVSRVIFAGRRAVGVVARHVGKTATFRARKAVIVAASAVQTPIILRSSGISHPLLGQRFQAHPGVSVAGVFDEPVRGGRGATQSYESLHYRAGERFKIESLHLPDELIASRFPGVGAPLAMQLQQLPYTALWAALLRPHAHGVVGGSLTMPMVSFRLTPEDCLILGQSVRTLCRLHLAAGARAVLPGVAGCPSEVTCLDQVERLPRAVEPARVAMIISHMFGTAVMGETAATSVCDPFGRVHDTMGLYVADSSLFPTNLGVNPQHTIMAVAQHVAWGLLDESGDSGSDN